MLLNNAGELTSMLDKNGTVLALFGVFEKFLVESARAQEKPRHGGPYTSVRFRVSWQGVGTNRTRSKSDNMTLS